MTETCNHAYTRKISPDKAICLDCGRLLELHGKNRDKDKPLVMLPHLYTFDNYTWSKWNPWPLIPLRIAEKYGWYGSVHGMDDYLVMPIFRNGLPVNYSARRITNNGGKKYLVPADRTRYMWQSTDKLTPPVLVGEGVADAAWLSGIRNSVALLGNSGDLDMPLVIMLDGDSKGIEGAFRIFENQRKRGLFGSSVVVLSAGDPTDYTIQELKQIIRDQTGVRL